jgi:Glycosyl hydrolases family 39
LATLFALLTFLPINGHLAPTFAQSSEHGNENAGGRYYPATQHNLAPQFLDFYDHNGGVPQFGYPITEAHMENGYLVQWTERQRLEYHPENAGTLYEVLLGLLGRELTKGLDGPRFSDTTTNGERRTADDDTHFFTETGHLVTGDFLTYWQEHGGLRIFGYPISNSYVEGGLQIQWFERARMELHSDNPPSSRVLLGLLAYKALKERVNFPYVVQIANDPALDTNMEIGLAQGGESDDPGFFDNIRANGKALGPGLVRLDNIFNYYGIVHRAPDNSITYDWTKLDRVLDALRAMDKEALICLSYMPETMSVSGTSRVEAPADYDEWAALVTATVRHVNVERAMGVRYWEVWNEPNQWDFWRAPYPEYLKLYDVTAEAALKADPTVKIGGPATSYFSTDHIGEFLEHERYNVLMSAPAHVDFISWHSYGQTPDKVAANIRRMREILEGFPMFSPQIFITEFNVLQGGSGDTSSGKKTDKVDGAIAFLSSIESMQRESLDRAFLFELKDGPGPTSYWGRWGILTNDDKPKPLYYALKAYQHRPSGMLPIRITSGLTDGSLGIMAYGSPARATIFVWYTGSVGASVKLSLPPTFDNVAFDLTLFDETHNNPASMGDPTLGAWQQLNARDLVLELEPNSLVLITSQ